MTLALRFSYGNLTLEADMSHPDAPRLVELGAPDYPAILEVWRLAGLPVRPAGRDAPEAFAYQLADGRQRAVGIREGNRLIAVAVLTHDGRTGWINRLAVDPAYRRRGVGSALVAEAERWFRDDVGLEVFAALIEEENVASLALFEALGYGRPRVAYVSKRTRPDA
jgi:GNAT superfamily N-acetyltransferase